MLKQLVTAVGAGQVEIMWRSCGDRMEISFGGLYAGGGCLVNGNTGRDLSDSHADRAGRRDRRAGMREVAR
jgi:hypothetical protein